MCVYTNYQITEHLCFVASKFSSVKTFNLNFVRIYKFHTGRERLIRSHSSARFCFELSGNLN